MDSVLYFHGLYCWVPGKGHIYLTFLCTEHTKGRRGLFTNVLTKDSHKFHTGFTHFQCKKRVKVVAIKMIVNNRSLNSIVISGRPAENVCVCNNLYSVKSFMDY